MQHIYTEFAILYTAIKLQIFFNQESVCVDP